MNSGNANIFDLAAACDFTGLTLDALTLDDDLLKQPSVFSAASSVGHSHSLGSLSEESSSRQTPRDVDTDVEAEEEDEWFGDIRKAAESLVQELDTSGPRPRSPYFKDLKSLSFPTTDPTHQVPDPVQLRRPPPVGISPPTPPRQTSSPLISPVSASPKLSHTLALATRGHPQLAILPRLPARFAVPAPSPPPPPAAKGCVTAPLAVGTRHRPFHTRPGASSPMARPTTSAAYPRLQVLTGMTDAPAHRGFPVSAPPMAAALQRPAGVLAGPPPYLAGPPASQGELKAPGFPTYTYDYGVPVGDPAVWDILRRSMKPRA